MPSLKSLTVGARIALALSVPAIAALIASALVVLDRWQTAREMGEVAHLADYAPEIGLVVHDLQRERGASAGFIGSKGAKFGDQLKTLRPETDHAIDELKKNFANFHGDTFPDLKHELDGALAELTKLAEMRASVDSVGVSVPEMAKYILYRRNQPVAASHRAHGNAEHQCRRDDPDPSTQFAVGRQGARRQGTRSGHGRLRLGRIRPRVAQELCRTRCRTARSASPV